MPSRLKLPPAATPPITGTHSGTAVELSASAQAASAETAAAAGSLVGDGPALAATAGRVTPAAITTDLSALAKKASDTVKDVTQRVVATADGIDSDLRTAYQGAANCLAQVDAVRSKVVARQLEYYTAVMKTLGDTGVLPRDLVSRVFQTVAPQLVKDPKPQLWRLHNTVDAVYNNKPLIWSAVDAAALAANLQPTGTVRAFFFVHGWQYDGSRERAYYDWYEMERNAGFFTGLGPCAGAAAANCQVYFLAYDTSYPTTFDSIIRQGFASVLATAVSGNPRDLFGAVVWREYERRARVAGDYLASMLTPYAGGRATKNVIISHSLGSYLVAHAAHKLYTARPNDYARFKFWFPMASALPNNAFAPSSGQFFNAPKLVLDIRGYVRNYHSAVDDALSTMYYLASGGVPAMGQVGSSCTRPQCGVVDNEDTTRITGINHGPAGYLRDVMPMIATTILSA